MVPIYQPRRSVRSISNTSTYLPKFFKSLIYIVNAFRGVISKLLSEKRPVQPSGWFTALILDQLHLKIVLLTCLEFRVSLPVLIHIDGWWGNSLSNTLVKLSIDKVIHILLLSVDKNICILNHFHELVAALYIRVADNCDEFMVVLNCTSY